jgi:dTDP-4-amino-4,6-dideoxygalactose transaminase
VLNDWYAYRSNIPESFSAELKNTDLLLLFVSERAKPVGYLYVVQYLQRDNLQKQFDEVDIGILRHYHTPTHFQTTYNQLSFGKGDLAITERIHQNVLSLLIGSHLGKKHLKSIIDLTKVVLRA